MIHFDMIRFVPCLVISEILGCERAAETSQVLSASSIISKGKLSSDRCDLRAVTSGVGSAV